MFSEQRWCSGSGRKTTLSTLDPGFNSLVSSVKEPQDGCHCLLIAFLAAAVAMGGEFFGEGCVVLQDYLRQ